MSTYRNRGRVLKHERERARDERRAMKAEKRAIRRLAAVKPTEYRV